MTLGLIASVGFSVRLQNHLKCTLRPPKATEIPLHELLVQKILATTFCRPH